MKKVFHAESPRGHYHCDAAIVGCFDSRFQLGFGKYVKRLGIINPDWVKLAGGAKLLASPDHPADREFVLDQLRKSIRLHGTTRVILMVHSDCGAYGGLAGRFQNDAPQEAAFMSSELKHAAAYLREQLPNLEALGYFVDFDGIWEVDVTTQT